MASSYEARINLIVQGEQKVKALQDSITALSKQLKELTKLDIGGTFEESLVSRAISKLRVARQGEIKAVDGVVKGQRLINQNTESQLVKQLRLNAAVDLYGRRLKALSRTDAGDQTQFQGRIADIQKAFTFFKGKGSVQGVQAAATELGRIVEYSREVNRLETGRLKSQEKLQGFAAEISKFKALGLNTAKAEKAFESFAVNAGTNKYALAQKFNDILIRRLRLLKDESRENARVAKQQFGASSPIQGAVDLIDSPINKAMGTKAAVALAQQKQQAAADELKALQGGTKAAVSLARQKEKAAADELKALQKGTKNAVALAQQRQKALGAQRKDRNAMMQNAMIGGAFPMLFGGGAGAVIGGAAGGFIPGNPMMSIVTSALGTVVDQFAAAATEMGASLRDPITNFEKLKETNLFASKAQEFYIQKLIETGRITEATGAIQAQIIKKVGVSGYNDLTALGNASSDLSKAWADFNLQLQAAVAGPLAGLLAWLTEVVRLSTSSMQQQAERLDPAAFTKAQMEAISKTSTFGFGGNAAAYNKELDKLSAAIVSKNVAKIKPTKTTESEDLNTIELGIKAAEQQADIIKDAYRTGFRLQQQAIDLQRQGTDLQRRVANDIFNKQQEIARLQIDSDRKRQQIAIETVDLEYRRRISNEEGRVAEVLTAEADLMKTRAQGEADIGAAKRNLELDIDKQKRDTENYIYQLNRDIDSIRRAILAYEMDVADYRLKTERQIADERRIQAAANGGGGLLTGDITGQQITKATQDANKFTGIANQCAEAVKSFYNSLGVELPGVTAWADTVRKAGVVMTDFSKIKPGDIVAKGKPGDTSHVGVFTGGDNVFHQSANRGRKAGNFPDLGYFKQGGYFVRPSGMMGQLNDVGSQIQRPAVPTPSVSGAGGTMAALDAKSAGIRKEAVALQEKLNKLQEEAAVTRLQEIARGPIDLQQRKDAVQFATADLNVVKAVSTEEQERLALEAQSAVKLQIRLDRDKEILDKTKLQGVEREKLVKSLAEGVEITKQQIELDTQLLILAQQTRVEKEAAAIQAQIGVTGTGLQAGFVGAAGSAFENEMLKSGNTEQATRLAELTNQLTLAQVQAQGMESSVLAIGDAFGTAMTSGVASLIDGTATAQEVFANFLNTIAEALMKAAAQMIATYVAIGIARMFAGMGGGGGGNAATALGSNPNVAAYSGTGIGDIGIGTFGGFKANGGSVSSGQTYMVGERGPELFVPGRSGTIVANDKMGGGSTNVVVNVDAKGSSVEGNEQGANQLGRVISAAVQSELIKQQRPGGLLAR